MIIFVFWTLATDTIGAHRFQVCAAAPSPSFVLHLCDRAKLMPPLQLSIFLAINVVFGVLGVNSGIFLTTSFQRAIGVGWLLLTMVDVRCASFC